MSDLDAALALYDYALPEELIANAPASPRESARLLVAQRGSPRVQWDTFAGIQGYLPAHALLVLNHTKVIPARLWVHRENGSRRELLVLHWGERGVTALIRGHVLPGERLVCGGDCAFRVLEPIDTQWILQPLFPREELMQMLDRYGVTPIPPYIRDCPLSEDALRREYQSVFADIPGSSAAPTASLHFSEALLTALQDAGITFASITLHVGLGTFAPLRDQQWRSGTLHEEWYEIGNDAALAINAAKREGRAVIAVGTTVARTLESAGDEQGGVQATSGTTDLFIREGYTFRVIDGLITNFHVPRSSLLMLVSAFLGRERILELYREAIMRRCRFFSFGDGMLLLR